MKFSLREVLADCVVGGEGKEFVGKREVKLRDQERKVCFLLLLSEHLPAEPSESCSGPTCFWRLSLNTRTRIQQRRTRSPNAGLDSLRFFFFLNAVSSSVSQHLQGLLFITPRKKTFPHWESRHFSGSSTATTNHNSVSSWPPQMCWLSKFMTETLTNTAT